MSTPLRRSARQAEAAATPHGNVTTPVGQHSTASVATPQGSIASSIGQSDGTVETPTQLRRSSRRGRSTTTTPQGRLTTPVGQAYVFDEPMSERTLAPLNDNDLFRAPAPPSTSRRGRGGRGRGRGDAVGRAAIAEEVTDESSLFSMIKAGRSVNVIIDKWIQVYDRHPEQALVQLQQFFVSCSGCKGVISSVMIQKMDYKDIIRRLTEEFDEESGDYPLIMAGPQWKKFKTSFPEFVTLLIAKCKTNIVFDSKTMDGLIQLLTGLADSQVRAFRHTATFAAMKLSTALVKIACELESMKDLNQKQIDTEKRKYKKSGNERVAQLVQKKNDLEEHFSDVKDMIQYVFKSVFVHRYRDIVPEIRSVSIEELGHWIYLFPEAFLEDSYLKYIGWMLYDKNSDVRMKCLGALIPLYERRDLQESLELFTTKFKARICSMVRDKDYDVAIKACQLMTCVYNLLPNCLDLQSCEPIYELVYSANRGAAVAAGEFLNAKVFCAGQDIEHKRLLLMLVDFFIEGQLHSHATYLVDALIDTNPIVKDFATMAELLLSNESDTCANQLVEVMSCAVRQTATGKSPASRTQHHHKRGAVAVPPREARLLQEDRTKMTEDLIPVLPQLIKKFIAEQETLENLCDLPRYFILEMYLAGRQEKYLTDLMDALDEVIQRHTDPELLLVISRTLGAFLQNPNIAAYTEAPRHQIVSTVATSLKREIQRFHREDRFDEEDMAALLAAMRKMSIFAATQDLDQFDLWNAVLSLVSTVEKTPSRDIAEHAVQFLFLSLSNDFTQIYTKLEENPSENVAEPVRVLRARREQFLNVSETIMREGAAGVENAFLCVCDLLILFNWRLRQKNPALASLVTNVTTDFIHQMDCFVVDNVFVEDEEENTEDFEAQAVELSHKRRNLLAQFCKLIIYNILPISHMWIVLKHYERHFHEFGDIMKHMIHKVRDLHKLQCAHGVANAMIDQYKDIRGSVPNGIIEPLSEDFTSLNSLAKKLAQSFGSDHVKNRDVIAGIHREGILFALNEVNDEEAISEEGRSKNLLFLEALQEFSPKLLKQDRACVLNYLEKQVEPLAPDSNDEYWQPYLLYKGSLMDHGNETGASRAQNTPAPKRSRRARKNTESSED